MDDRHAKFESLPEERREAIVSAAVETFGKNDYKNALTETIARRAGISKGLLFFYFKNKKELYLYLMEHLMEKVSNLVLDDGYWEIDDFQGAEQVPLPAGVLHPGLLPGAQGHKGYDGQLDAATTRLYVHDVLQERAV